jgi:restriction endonuclease S subunit
MRTKIGQTAIGTTIPHLREERLKQIAIPILDKEITDKIFQKIKTAFELKEKRKNLICLVLDEINAEYLKYN